MLPIRRSGTGVPPSFPAPLVPVRIVGTCVAAVCVFGLLAGDLPGLTAVVHAAAEGHEETIWDLLARIVNFAVLAGTLFFLLRGPLATYLENRSRQIRSELIEAAEMRKAATEHLARIEEQLKGLPDELEALKARGREEVEAEEARIRRTAEAERDRLLAQARREIDLQLRIARKELLLEAADLAVAAAAERIRRTITPDDQRRLVERYVAQVTSSHVRG